MAMLPKRERQLLYAIYPSLLLPLIRNGHLNSAHLKDIELAKKILSRRIRFATSRMTLSVGLEYSFAEGATDAWKKDQKEQAIVLLATSLEQCLNACLRLIIEARGFRTDHVTELMRSQGIEPKLTWLFEMHSRKTMPLSLRRRARKVFEIRNAIVHYKAVFAHPDSDDDSHSKIKKEINELGRFRPMSFFNKFQEFCWTTVGICDPSIKLAIELREKLIPFEKIA